MWPQPDCSRSFIMSCLSLCHSHSGWWEFPDRNVLFFVQAEEKKRRDSVCRAHVLTGGPRFTQWATEHRAGCCTYWALVHGTRRTEKRDPAEWNCGDVVFTARWAQDLKHSSQIFRPAWKDCVLWTATSVLISCRPRPISSHVGPVGNGWRAGRIPLRPVCIQRLCLSVPCLLWAQRFAWPTKPHQCWWFIFQGKILYPTLCSFLSASRIRVTLTKSSHLL